MMLLQFGNMGKELAKYTPSCLPSRSCRAARLFSDGKTMVARADGSGRAADPARSKPARSPRSDELPLPPADEVPERRSAKAGEG